MRGLVIIPAYNEEGAILDTVCDIREKAPDFDVLVINDCSTDGTEEILLKHQISHVSLSMNLGIGAAVQTGYIYAKKHSYDVAVQMDGDGQHDAAYLGVMLQALVKSHADMVIGSRFLDDEGYKSSRLRRVGISFFTRWISLLTGQTITDPTSGMRMVGRRLIGFFAEEYPKDYPEPETVVTALKGGASIVEVPVAMRERTSGRSSISLQRAFYYMVKVSMACLMASWSADISEPKEKSKHET